jgi:hypothetical protein
MVTFGLVLVADIVVEVTDVVLAFVVLVVVVGMAVTRKSSISAVLCFEAVNIFDPPTA